MPGRLNTFQKSMLQWNDLHPYNAVHVVWIPGALDRQRLGNLIAATLERKGLTGLTLNRDTGTYEYRGGATELELKVRETSGNATDGLVEEIELQLNTPFPQARSFCPFRAFVLPEAAAFALGLVYFHPIADAESIVLLLTELADAYRGKIAAGTAKPLELYPRVHDNLLRHPAVLARRLASFPGLLRQTRRASRPHYRDSGDLTNKFGLFSLDPPQFDRFVHASKTLGVTLNDLFLALLAKAVAGVAPSRTGRRNGISVGCIVNIRKDLGIERGTTFGLMLGSFVVQHSVPIGMNVADLARQIAKQTAGIKRHRLYLGAVLELTLGRRLASLFPVERRKRLYQKHYPLWGGLTNMNLNQLWPEAQANGPVDYLRAVSTGPVTPLVLSISSVGRKANVGVTYRSTVFSPSEIEQIKKVFVEPEHLPA